jgi:outer membrane protein assembly factor BamB
MIKKTIKITTFGFICLYLLSTSFKSDHSTRPPEDLPMKTLWKFNLESNSTLPIPVFDKGTIYIYNNQGKLYALDPKKGAKKWEFKASGKLYSPPSILNDVMYVLGYDGNLYALYTANAKIKWSAKTFPELGATPYAVGGKEVVIIRGNKMQAFDLETGLDLWKKDCSVMNYRDIYNYPDFLLYTDHTRFVAEKVSKCETVWDYIPGNMTVDYYQATNDNVILSTDKILFVLNVNEGKVAWKLNTNPKEISTKGPIFGTFENEIFVVTNNLVRIYDLKSGALKKTFKNKEDIKRILVTDQKMLLFNELDEVYLINRSEYKKGDKYILNEKIKSDLYLFNNQLYFIDTEDNLVAVEIPQ